MYELLAIAAGVLLGVVAHNLVTARSKVTTLILGSLIVGATAASLSGELLESWAYLLFDVAQVLLAAGATTVALTWWRHRPRRRVGG